MTQDSQLARELDELRLKGYVVLRDLIDADTCTRIRDAMLPLLDPTGRNPFEGLRTQRVYSVLSKTRVVDRLADHPRVLALLAHVLRPGYLLSQLQAIQILPDEAAQALHFDDALYPVPRPRPPLGAATIWAIDAFTSENGATVVLPGSHTWGATRSPSERDVCESVIMPAGSCVFFVGTLWHGGGANRSAAPRLAITAQYCEPWLRPQEAFSLSVDRMIAATLSEELISMLGYSIYPPFMGMVDGVHPRRLLAAERL